MIPFYTESNSLAQSQNEEEKKEVKEVVVLASMDDLRYGVKSASRFSVDVLHVSGRLYFAAEVADLIEQLRDTLRLPD